jgi:hypothetical protein
MGFEFYLILHHLDFLNILLSWILQFVSDFHIRQLFKEIDDQRFKVDIEDLVVLQILLLKEA